MVVRVIRVIKAIRVFKDTMVVRVISAILVANNPIKSKNYINL